MARVVGNRELLIDRLFQGRVRARDPFFSKKSHTLPQKIKKAETSHLQSMARLFAEELTALSEGAAGCKEHPTEVAGVCPWCRGLFAGEEVGDDA